MYPLAQGAAAHRGSLRHEAVVAIGGDCGGVAVGGVAPAAAPTGFEN